MPRGEISSGKPSKRHPLDWYVDEVWCARQLAAALGGFAREKARGECVWDPACGMGNTLQAAWELGIEVFGTDVVDNLDRAAFASVPGLQQPWFFSSDFLEFEKRKLMFRCTIVCNPPYSYRKVQGVAIAELFARQALKLATGRVCLLLPTKWLASQRRFDLFVRDHPPAAVLQLTQRPSMPPGDRIAAMGNRAFRGGMIDYCWIVWDVAQPTRPGETRLVWLPPLGQPIEPVEGLA